MKDAATNRVNSRRGRRGSAMVESSLVLILFICIMSGIMDFGQFLYLHTTIVERTRNAARLAVVNSYTNDQIKSLIAYNSTTAPAQVNGSYVGGFYGLTPDNVTVNTFDTTNTDQRMVVDVTNLSFKTFSPFFVGSRTAIPVRVTIPMEAP